MAAACFCFAFYRIHGPGPRVVLRWKELQLFCCALIRGECLPPRAWARLEITPNSRPPASHRSSPENPSRHPPLPPVVWAVKGLGERGAVLFRKREPALDLERSELKSHIAVN